MKEEELAGAAEAPPTPPPTAVGTRPGHGRAIGMSVAAGWDAGRWLRVLGAWAHRPTDSRATAGAGGDGRGGSSSRWQVNTSLHGGGGAACRVGCWLAGPANKRHGGSGEPGQAEQAERTESGQGTGRAGRGRRSGDSGVGGTRAARTAAADAGKRRLACVLGRGRRKQASSLSDYVAGGQLQRREPLAVRVAAGGWRLAAGGLSARRATRPSTGAGQHALCPTGVLRWGKQACN